MDVATNANDEQSLHNLSPEQVDEILSQHAEASVLHQTALEMHWVSSTALSEIDRQKDTLFGDGLWILEHLDKLDEAQRLAAQEAMAKWDTGALSRTNMVLID